MTFRNLVWKSRRCGTRTAVLLLLLSSSPGLAEDTIEFLSGAKTSGKVVQIRKAKREIVFEAQLAGRRLREVYPYSKIHAVTYRGKRHVFNQKTGDPTKLVNRSPREVEKLIANGAQPPDWFDGTPLEYPDTLDLSWPHPAPKPWNNRKNMGQYIWDRINPNDSKWRSGIRLLHHLLTLHEQDPEKSKRIMTALGGMYFRLFQDYPRAAYWWRRARVSKSDINGIGLAECYYRLGSKKMALAALDTRRFRVETIKLLGNMGETERAAQMAATYARQMKEPQWGLLAGGDACRSAGKYEQAISFYEQVLKASGMRNEQYERRARSRAQQSIDAIKRFELLDISKVANGEYTAETLGYEGPIEVKVKVVDGRIEDVAITKHKEKQYYSALRDMPAQIIAKQSVKDVVATSRATITAEAIVSATAKALVEEMSPAPSRREFR